jgi:ubiquinone/menaquinone biosynthesis C-methylase UbiE
VEYDRTPLPDVYVQARTLPADSLAVWADLLREIVPPPPPSARLLDLGCGTGRFTTLLAEVFGVAVLGIDPSLRMLARREAPDASRARFVAGAAEAVPVATGSIDLVLLSMVYHHVRVPEALLEVRRVLRPGGHVVVRNPTRECLDHYLFLAFFPEAKAIDVARMPTRAGLAADFLRRGFTAVSHRTVSHVVAGDPRDWYRKVSLRALSSLQLISDEAFTQGLREFEAYCRTADPDRPVREPLDLFVFTRVQ